MGRKPCCAKVGLKKGSWTAEEDKKLIDFMLTGCHLCSWGAVPELAGLLRCGKSCRLRWTNYLRPDLRRGQLSEAEEKLVIELHSKLGNRWSKIAAHLPGRTDNEIKNMWNTHIKKKVTKLGADPAAARAGRSSCEADVALVNCPEFGIDEVPIAQPDEIVIVLPCDVSAWTPTSPDIPPSSCHSPGSSAGDSSPAFMEFTWELGDD